MDTSSPAAPSANQAPATPSSAAPAATPPGSDPGAPAVINNPESKAPVVNPVTPPGEGAQTPATVVIDNEFTKSLGDLGKDPALKDIKDAQGLAKAYLDTKAMVGKPRFDVPGEGATPEQVKEFRTKLGVPETPEGYNLKVPEGLQEHVGEYMTETLGEFQKVCHEAGVPPKAAEAIQTWFDNMTVELQKADATAETERMTALDNDLSKMYTETFGDQAVAVSANTQDVLSKAIPAELRAKLEPALDNRALQAIGLVHEYMRKTYGQSDNNIEDPGAFAGKSLEDLRKEASDIMASKEYRDPMHPDNATVRAKANAMYKHIGSLTDAGKIK